MRNGRGSIALSASPTQCSVAAFDSLLDRAQQHLITVRLFQNSTAPPPSSRAPPLAHRRGPVINMIGIGDRRSVARRFCRSRPLRSGSMTSNTRQLGTRAGGRGRNSCAEANICGCHPAKRIRSSSDSRTEMSSSTTNTIGVPRDVSDGR